MSEAKGSTLTIGKRVIPLTNVDKVLYPSSFTKGQVVDYYVQIAPVMLPHLKGRAVTLKRYPNGSKAPFFFEKRCPSHKPEWVKVATVNGKEGNVVHCVLDDVASLAWVGNLAALELHVPLAKAATPNRPTWLVFDLDPGAPATLNDCAKVALRMRDLLGHMNMESMVKTSGSKGLHLYAPLNTAVTFDQTKSFARSVAELLERDTPKDVTATMTRSVRTGRIFVDWSQNDQHKTTACVYTLRATDRPTVSTPLLWAEVESLAEGADPAKFSFVADQVLKRVKKHGDLFEPLLKLKQKLPSFN